MKLDKLSDVFGGKADGIKEPEVDFNIKVDKPRTELPKLELKKMNVFDTKVKGLDSKILLDKLSPKNLKTNSVSSFNDKQYKNLFTAAKSKTDIFKKITNKNILHKKLNSKIPGTQKPKGFKGIPGLGGFPKGLTGKPKGLSGKLPKGFNQKLPKGLSSITTPQRKGGKLPSQFNQKLPKGLGGKLPKGFNNTLPKGLSGNTPKNLDTYLPKGLGAKGVSNGIPKGAAKALAGLGTGLPTGMSNGIPKGAAKALASLNATPKFGIGVAGKRIKQQQGLSLFGDYDKDGVKNIFDCNPLDRTKQDTVEANQLLLEESTDTETLPATQGTREVTEVSDVEEDMREAAQLQLEGPKTEDINLQYYKEPDESENITVESKIIEAEWEAVENQREKTKDAFTKQLKSRVIEDDEVESKEERVERLKEERAERKEERAERKEERADLASELKLQTDYRTSQLGLAKGKQDIQIAGLKAYQTKAHIRADLWETEKKKWAIGDTMKDAALITGKPTPLDFAALSGTGGQPIYEEKWKKIGRGANATFKKVRVPTGQVRGGPGSSGVGQMSALGSTGAGFQMISPNQGQGFAQAVTPKTGFDAAMSNMSLTSYNKQGLPLEYLSTKDREIELRRRAMEQQPLQPQPVRPTYQPVQQQSVQPQPFQPQPVVQQVAPSGGIPDDPTIPGPDYIKTPDGRFYSKRSKRKVIYPRGAYKK